MILLVVCAIAASQFLPLAIPTTIVPPANPADPVTVFLVDYGRTPSLILSEGDNRMVAYVYGDWAYYALRKQGPYESIAALLWPTQGTLGRKEITGPIKVETIRQGLGVEFQHVFQFKVERAAVESLRATLDRIYDDHASTATHAYGMTFVHHPKSYHILVELQSRDGGVAETTRMQGSRSCVQLVVAGSVGQWSLRAWRRVGEFSRVAQHIGSSSGL